MSNIRINIIDKDQSINSDVHGCVGNALIAALSAEPETIDELGLALARFQKPDPGCSPFTLFYKGENFTYYDAGILVIDLAGRTIGCESTYSFPSKEGEICYLTDQGASDFLIRYRLPDDWLILHSIPGYKGVALKRRNERLKNPPIDFRKILYGDPMREFIIKKVDANLHSENEEIFADIHSEWLMTRRADLRGKNPREALFDKHDLVDFDLFSREHQWSFAGECPPPIPPDFFAYRYAGFGTHEIVTYYELFRYLLERTLEKRRNGMEISLEYLRESQDTWLKTPDSEFTSRTPGGIIDCERKRLPLTASSAEVLIDDDCPVCIAMAEDFDTPTFWHLDGCNMDDRFEFSFKKTRKDWETERLAYEKFNREFEENYGTLESGSLEFDDEGPS
jgi:hypothetical protein